MGNFKELRVWQRAKDLAIKIYQISDAGVLSKDFGLRDQLRRSSISIASNIAEGDELDTEKQALRHLYMAKGSTAELYTQIIIAREINSISEKEYKDIADDCQAILSMLFKLIQVKQSRLE